MKRGRRPSRPRGRRSSRRRSLRIAPHAGDRRLAPRQRELSNLDEAKPLVVVIVGPIARLKVGWESQLIDAREVRGQQPHALALPAVVWMGSKQTQVIVRLPPWMVGIEAIEQGEHVLSMGAQHFAE